MQFCQYFAILRLIFYIFSPMQLFCKKTRNFKEFFEHHITNSAYIALDK